MLTSVLRQSLVRTGRVGIRATPSALLPRPPPGALWARPTRHKPGLGPMTVARPFSVWRIPFYLATASKLKRRVATLGALGVTSLLGVMLGPMFWITLSGVGAIVAWRLWRQTSRWWQLLGPASTNIANAASWGPHQLMNILRRQVGTHRGTEQVHHQAVEAILRYAKTDRGHHALLDHLEMDHANDITFFPPHLASTIERQTTINGKKETINEIHIEFWAEDDGTPGGRGGSCIVKATASVDHDGHIQLTDLKLAAPGMHATETVPLDMSYAELHNVVEGEYRNL